MMAGTALPWSQGKSMVPACPAEAQAPSAAAQQGLTDVLQQVVS